MSTTKTSSWYAERYVTKYGMSLVPIEPKRKFPTANDWGNNLITDAANATSFYNENPDFNIGLALSSGYCSLDIDCYDSFLIILDEFGISPSELESYPTIRGASKGMRLLFKVPEGLSLPYCKVNWPSKADPKKKYTVIELRAATDGKQRQDVLPPSIHPDTGKPYKWIVQPPKTSEWPTPPDWLLSIWGAWDSFKPQLVDACPWLEKQTVRKQEPITSKRVEGSDVFDAFKAANPLPSTLERYGYKRIGKRYLSPHSGTGLPGVIVFDDSCWIHHASDPLCSEESGHPVDSFDLFTYYDHNGDSSAAFKAAASQLGIELSKPKQAKRQATTPAESSETEEQQDAWPCDFRCLGFNEGNGFFLPSRTEQVTRISLGSVRKQNLLQLASLEWWESMFPSKTGVDWDAAYNYINRQCELTGVYDATNQRGRGAWFDDGRSVLHLGDRLMIDNARVSLTDYKGSFIYARQPAFENGFDAVPATTDDGKVLADIFRSLSWASSTHAIFTMGWVALAPVCGALSWRPHLWLTAQRGSGKTWVQENIIDKLVGRMMVYCQGGTTEAGIRQKIQFDARPVMFDEAESENTAAMSRVQHVIELARQSSSDTGAEIMKGTVNGSGMSFRMRSMFMMGSINVGLKQAADESRFTVVSLNKSEKTEESIKRFRQLESHVLDTLNDDFCKSIRARAYHMIPIIRQNAKTFSTAVAIKMGSQRIGDQVGTLLAGFWCLLSDDIFTESEAKTLVNALDLEEAKEAEAVSDEANCLNRILQRQVRVETSTGAVNRSLGELIRAAIGTVDANIDKLVAVDSLPRFGIKYERGYIHISNSHHEIENSLQNTPWQSGWNRILGRLDGAKLAKSPTRFAGSLTRYVSLPISLFDD